ncbi:hypothetical protein AB1E18_015739 [Capra hircus]
MRTVKHHTRKGVPLEHWARAWVGVSEALAQMERNPGHDYCVLGGERNDSLEETLRTCMKRCLPRQREVPAERGPLLAEDPVSCAANRPAPQLRGQKVCNSREVEALHSRKPICLAITAGAMLISSLPATFYVCFLLGKKKDFCLWIKALFSVESHRLCLLKKRVLHEKYQNG